MRCAPRTGARWCAAGWPTWCCGTPITRARSCGRSAWRRAASGSAASPSPRNSAPPPPAWHAAVMAARTPAVQTAPVTIVVGEEEFLIDRAVRDLIAAAEAGDVHDLDGAALGAGGLGLLA